MAQKGGVAVIREEMVLLVLHRLAQRTRVFSLMFWIDPCDLNLLVCLFALKVSQPTVHDTGVHVTVYKW